MASLSLISSNLIKKHITHPAIYSLTRIPNSPTIPPPSTTIKPEKNPPKIFLKTPPTHHFSIPQELPRTPNVPEKPADPPPLTPNPAPEFPGPPKPDPEIQPPGPDMPVPPNTPGGPEVVPPRTPEWTPPDPPEVVPQHPAPPEAPLPYVGLV